MLRSIKKGIMSLLLRTLKAEEKMGTKGNGKNGSGAMRENATYGGHMELSAFADMTRRDVKGIQPCLVYGIRDMARLHLLKRR